MCYQIRWPYYYSEEARIRIDAEQRIAGLFAHQIRHLMRRTGDGWLTLESTSEVLHVSGESACRIVVVLNRLGYILRSADHWELTLKGKALAKATSAKPLRRNTADKLINDLIARAKRISADDSWAYTIELLAIFGSYLTDKERPNDIDVAYKLKQRWKDEKRQAEEADRRRGLREAGFRNTVEWACWPQIEILKFLKSRSRGISLEPFDDWIKKKTRYKLIFGSVHK